MEEEKVHKDPKTPISLVSTWRFWSRLVGLKKGQQDFEHSSWALTPENRLDINKPDYAAYIPEPREWIFSFKAVPWPLWCLAAILLASSWNVSMPGESCKETLLSHKIAMKTMSVRFYLKVRSFMRRTLVNSMRRIVLWWARSMLAPKKLRVIAKPSNLRTTFYFMQQR